MKIPQKNITKEEISKKIVSAGDDYGERLVAELMHKYQEILF
jgi:hypothetical protein